MSKYNIYGYQNKIHRNHFTFDFCAITHRNQFLFTCNSLFLYIIIYERKRNLHKLEQIHILSLLPCHNVGILALLFYSTRCDTKLLVSSMQQSTVELHDQIIFVYRSTKAIVFSYLKTDVQGQRSRLISPSSMKLLKLIFQS